MLSDPTVYIFGTDHKLQCVKVNPQVCQDLIDDYKKEIRNIVESEEIQVLYEEWHPNFAINSCYKGTHLEVWHSTGELSLNPVPVDIGPTHRSEWACVRSCINFPLFEPEDQYKAVCPNMDYAAECDCMLLVDEVRERVWVAQIRRKNEWPALLVCGADHTTRLRELFERFGVACEILHKDFGNL